MSQISKEVYTIKPTSEQDRIAAAHRLGTRLHTWRASLPPHLGSIRPSSLIPSLRRQATILRLAYSHAIMHANRLFLLGPMSSHSEPQISECIAAARVVFETVDGIAREGRLFYSFWWTHYVTFCALLVTYVWEIREDRRGGGGGGGAEDERLLELAARCHRHLANATATNSPSRRYAVILEEFRREATGRVSRCATPPPPPTGSGEQARPPVAQPPVEPLNGWVDPQLSAVDGVDYSAAGYDGGNGMAAPLQFGSAFLDEWQTTDWLDLDSSVRKIPPLPARRPKPSRAYAHSRHLGRIWGWTLRQCSGCQTGNSIVYSHLYFYDIHLSIPILTLQVPFCPLTPLLEILLG